MALDRRFAGRLLLLGGGLTIAWFFSRDNPKDHRFSLLLGPGASEVEEIVVRTFDDSKEPIREARYHYTPGTAPSVISQEIRLQDGDYAMEIEAFSRNDRKMIRRRVTLGRETVRVDISEAVSR